MSYLSVITKHQFDMIGIFEYRDRPMECKLVYFVPAATSLEASRDTLGRGVNLFFFKGKAILF